MDKTFDMFCKNLPLSVCTSKPVLPVVPVLFRRGNYPPRYTYDKGPEHFNEWISGINTKIYSITCSGNELRELPIIKTTDLICRNNQLTTLDAPYSAYIDCGMNPITTLNAPKANILCCDDTLLTVINAPNADIINCKNNPNLECINAPMLKQLTYDVYNAAGKLIMIPLHPDLDICDSDGKVIDVSALYTEFH